MPYMDMEQLEHALEDASKFMEFHGVDDLVWDHEMKSSERVDQYIEECKDNPDLKIPDDPFPVETVKFSVGYLIELWNHIHDAMLWLPEIREAMDEHCEVRNVIRSDTLNNREKYFKICEIVGLSPSGERRAR